MTLILRLCVNLMAGHVIISVVGGLVGGCLVGGGLFGFFLCLGGGRVL